MLRFYRGPNNVKLKLVNNIFETRRLYLDRNLPKYCRKSVAIFDVLIRKEEGLRDFNRRSAGLKTPKYKRPDCRNCSLLTVTL